MNKRKMGATVCLGALFIVVFIVSFIQWKSAEDHSKAENGASGTSVTAPINGTKGSNNEQEIIYFDSSFYNYKYDNEIYGKGRNQGAQSCYDGGVVPFGVFDSKLSDYYKENKVKVGIYTGNFYNYYGGLVSKKIDFPGYYYFRWAANIANRHSPYDAVCQNIVSAKLDGFDEDDVTSGTLMSATSSGGTVNMPYFDAEFLSQKVNGVTIGEKKEHIGFPFRKVTSGSKKGYYEFDSDKDVVSFQNGSTTGNYFGNGSLNYYYNQKKVYCAASSKAQFFPYNTTNGSGKLASNSDAQKSIDYGFGVRFNIPFRLSDDGTKDGKPMVFEFEGDDDVWVFLDGKLVLDLGGDHGPASGTIDFSDAGGGGSTEIKTTVSKVAYANGSTDAAETVMSDKIMVSDTYIKSNVSKTVTGITKGEGTQHVLTIFYMERGMFESNFRMSFNFVPAPPDATPTPAPTVTPEPVQANDSSLKIQNTLKLTDKNNKFIINPAFQQKVYDRTEEDVFQYSIANRGTTANQVGDSGIKYPSGKLTVRQNEKTTNKDKSYLSFGAEPKVRVYFDLNKSKYLESTDDQHNKKWSGEQPYINVNDGRGDIPMIKYTEGIFYYDVTINKEIKFSDGTEECKTHGGVGVSIDSDGKIFECTALGANGTLAGDFSKIEKYPGIKDKNVLYSEGLPYQDAGSTPAPTFSPSTSTEFSNVSNTSYELEEAYLAPTADAKATAPKILSNSARTAGITDTNGKFNLFYDDSATFKNQFAKGSRMQVVQNDDLLQPSRCPDDTITETSNPDNVLTKFVTPSSTAKIRKASDYYYTTVTAASISGSESTPIDVTYDNQFDYTNGSDNNNTDPINITETFTNTVKTGSLTIAKELKGNADENNKYSYVYTISFSNVFGDNSSEAEYTGTYDLYAVDGTKTTKNITTGITLHPGEKAVISGIPVGTAYKIVETPSDETVVSDMKVTYKAIVDDETDAITSPEYHTQEEDTSGLTKVDKNNRTIEGVIPCSITNKKYNTSTSEYKKVDVEVTYTNQFGSICITKQIAGDVNESQYYQNIENTEKTYIFKVKKGDALYSGKYKLYTYENGNGDYTSPTVTTTTETITNGSITLKQNQKAELCELPLTAGDTSYTIQEIIESTDIFYLESIGVTEGEDAVTSTATPSAITTMTLSDSNPSVQLIYTNRYSNSFIQIDKYISDLYCGDTEYGEGIKYQDLTNANQSFVFTVKQYKTQEEAEAGTTTPENTFTVTLNTKDAEKAKIKVGDKEYYKISKKLKVVANRYYRITEDTDWAWKYNLAQIGFSTYFRQENFQDAIFAKLLPSASDTVESSTANEQNTKTVLASDAKSAAVILKSNRDEKALPIAQFYNQLKVPGSNETPFPEGDTDDAVNKIKKTK